jgi:eukaryotic-like serine/threonine-protein kinase
MEMDKGKPSIDELLEQLEEARDAGREINLEQLCAPWPDLLPQLRERWNRLLRFDNRFGDKPDDIADATRRENTAEVQSKIANMIEKLDGSRVIMQTEIHLEKFHDRGGLGDVYRAQDCDLSREVAVKLLRIDRQGEGNREDFFRESQIIGGMNHPGIVSIHGIGETIDGRPFYTMPFLDGGTLRYKAGIFHRKFSGALVEDLKEFRDLLYHLVSVCKTIAYAHSRGIVHRDLKAENVLLGKYGETLVIDWGCASKVDRDERFRVYGERTLQLKGVDGVNSSGGLTLRYASPEQLHGSKHVGPESDIYSLGAILYLLVTGRSPLEQEPDDKVRGMVLKGQVPGPETIKSRLPSPLAAICRKAMALEPHDRYGNALQMADDLERYLADLPTSVCKLSWGMRMARMVKRNRKASLILLTTLLVCMSLLTLALAGQSVMAGRAQASARHRLRMAAALVSNVGGFEISRRTSLLEIEASKAELIETMKKIEANPNNEELWEDAQSLVYEFRDDLEASGIKLDSLFLNDSRGTQVARAPKEDSIGKNFAYRQYFHGGEKDFDPESPEYTHNPPRASAETIVSNVYVSSNKAQSGQVSIKTAFSVPIVVRNQETTRVVGRLGMSLQIQELGIFDSLKDLPLRAVLFETRQYPWGTGTAQGLILDRFNSGIELVADSEADQETQPTNLSEEAIKDAMVRLTPQTLAKVMTSSAQGDLIADFSDPAIGNDRSATACAELRIPYREGLDTGWKVLFIEIPDP